MGLERAPDTRCGRATAAAAGPVSEQSLLSLCHAPSHPPRPVTPPSWVHLCRSPGTRARGTATRWKIARSLLRLPLPRTGSATLCGLLLRASHTLLWSEPSRILYSIAS